MSKLISTIFNDDDFHKKMYSFVIKMLTSNFLLYSSVNVMIFYFFFYQAGSKCTAFCLFEHVLQVCYVFSDGICHKFLLTLSKSVTSEPNEKTKIIVSELTTYRTLHG